MYGVCYVSFVSCPGDGPRACLGSVGVPVPRRGEEGMIVRSSPPCSLESLCRVGGPFPGSPSTVQPPSPVSPGGGTSSHRPEGEDVLPTAGTGPNRGPRPWGSRVRSSEQRRNPLPRGVLATLVPVVLCGVVLPEWAGPSTTGLPGGGIGRGEGGVEVRGVGLQGRVPSDPVLLRRSRSSHFVSGLSWCTCGLECGTDRGICDWSP